MLAVRVVTYGRCLFKGLRAVYVVAIGNLDKGLMFRVCCCVIKYCTVLIVMIYLGRCYDDLEEKRL